MKPEVKKEPNHRAALVVFIAMFGIGAACLGIGLYSHCQRESEYLDPAYMSPHNPHRLDERKRRSK